MTLYPNCIQLSIRRQMQSSLKNLHTVLNRETHSNKDDA